MIVAAILLYPILTWLQGQRGRGSQHHLLHGQTSTTKTCVLTNLPSMRHHAAASCNHRDSCQLWLPEYCDSPYSFPKASFRTMLFMYLFIYLMPVIYLILFIWSFYDALIISLCYHEFICPCFCNISWLALCLAFILTVALPLSNPAVQSFSYKFNLLSIASWEIHYSSRCSMNLK